MIIHPDKSRTYADGTTKKFKKQRRGGLVNLAVRVRELEKKVKKLEEQSNVRPSLANSKRRAAKDQ